MASIANVRRGEASCGKLEHGNDEELLNYSCESESYNCHDCRADANSDDDDDYDPVSYWD